MGHLKDERHQQLSPGMALFSRSCPERQRVGGTRGVLALHMVGDLRLVGPLTCVDWKFFTRHANWEHAARRFPSAKHDALASSGISPSSCTVVSVLWTLGGKPNELSSSLSASKRDITIQEAHAKLALVLFHSHLVHHYCAHATALVVYHVHLMQAARRRPIPATKLQLQ
jgi:hypothetical protein